MSGTGDVDAFTMLVLVERRLGCHRTDKAIQVTELPDSPEPTDQETTPPRADMARSGGIYSSAQRKPQGALASVQFPCLLGLVIDCLDNIGIT